MRDIEAYVKADADLARFRRSIVTSTSFSLDIHPFDTSRTVLHISVRDADVK